MNKMTVNKIVGAVLASLLVIVGMSTLVEILYPGGEDEHGHGQKTVVMPGIPTGEEQKAEVAAKTEKPAEEAKPLAVLLASADPAKGEKAAKKCAACHTFDKGGPNRVGPNLYGILGRKVAAGAGFAYSEALKAHGGAWTYDLLNCWIENPKECISGNKMSFAGIDNPGQRADLIVYLRTLSDNPEPLPEPKGAAEATSAAPAKTEAAPAAAPSAPAQGAQSDAVEAQPTGVPSPAEDKAMDAATGQPPVTAPAPQSGPTAPQPAQGAQSDAVEAQPTGVPSAAENKAMDAGTGQPPVTAPAPQSGPMAPQSGQ